MYSFESCLKDDSGDYFATIMDKISGGMYHTYLSKVEEAIYEALPEQEKDEYIIFLVKRANMENIRNII